MLVGQDDRFDSGIHAEMPIHPLQMLLDGLRANAQRKCNVLVRESFQQPSEYSFLSD